MQDPEQPRIYQESGGSKGLASVLGRKSAQRPQPQEGKCVPNIPVTALLWLSLSEYEELTTRQGCHFAHLQRYRTCHSTCAVPCPHSRTPWSWPAVLSSVQITQQLE